MLSRTERRGARSPLLALTLAVLIAAAWTDRTHAQNPAPSEAEIQRAVEQLKSDPNLGTERSVRTLKWVNEDDPPEIRDAAWQTWLKNFFGWIGSAGRLVLWVTIALLVALLAVYLARRARTLEGSPRRPHATAPTHVREMDIRPESLPEDIGAAAMTLWNSAQHRAALALLYRGLLSRLVHVHSVAIKQSSTESECLDLARPRLQDNQVRYVAQLLAVWQRAVYGGKDPQADDVRTLCDNFAAALGASASPAQRLE